MVGWVGGVGGRRWDSARVTECEARMELEGERGRDGSTATGRK